MKFKRFYMFLFFVCLLGLVSGSINYKINNQNYFSVNENSPAMINGGMNITSGHLYIASGNLHMDGDLIHDQGNVSFSGGSSSFDTEDMVLFGNTDIDNADDGKEIRTWRKAPEGNDYIRTYITSSQNALTHSNTNILFQNADGKNIQFNSGQHIYLNLGDQAGSDEVRIRDNAGLEIGTIDSNGNVWYRGDLSIGVSSDVLIQANGDSYFNGGYVGIGTTSPQLPLDVRNVDDNLALFFDSRAQAQGVGGGIAFGGKYTDAGAEAMSGRIGTQKTNGISGDIGFDMVFETQDSEGSITQRMILKSDGKVGIGDITPTFALDVDGAARIREEFYTDSDVEVGGTLIVDSNYVVEGGSSKTVMRKIQLAIRDGATPGTNIDVTQTTTQGRAYNSPTFTNANDLGKSGASGSYTLSANGENLILNFTDATSTHVLAVNVLSDDLNNGGGGGYYVHTLVYGGIIQLMLEKSGSATNLDWTAHTNTGSDEIIFDVLFVTSD